ncbi:hypothetical protein EV183_002024 [Coemansia sp. RSA 2336]|nr:hypothetical protein EV183_002024 [Coemansia sp. RSA 2336]
MGDNATLAAFVKSVDDAFTYKDGLALSKLIVFDDHALSVFQSRIHISDDLDSYVSCISSPIQLQIALTYLNYVRYKQPAACNETHMQLCRLAELFTSLLASAQGPWLIPAIRSMAVALCLSAQQVAKQTDDASVFTQSATRLLQLLIVILSDSTTPIASSKRVGALVVAGLLLRISLRTSAAPGAYAGKALEAKALVSLPGFPQRDRITYSYWLGRYYLVCYYIDAARKQLEYAFSKCPYWHYHNKRAILRHLVAANMLRGQLPSKDLLEKYDMEPVYYDLVACFKQGNLHLFQQHLVDNMEFFRSQGNFLLLLERTKLLIYRNALRKVALLNADAERANVLQYRDVLAAFRLASRNFEMDVLEMESILASLISQKMVLGYLFHHHQVVNLSH